MNILERKRDEIITMCSRHKVARLFVFGSVLTDGFDSHSDIDLLVDFKDVDIYDYADNYFNFKFYWNEY
jgi:predicted nucleotidyltransferase